VSSLRIVTTALDALASRYFAGGAMSTANASSASSVPSPMTTTLMPWVLAPRGTNVTLAEAAR
jgi:hypothetical protein